MCGLRLSFASLVGQSLGLQIGTLPIVVCLDQGCVALPEKDWPELWPDRGKVPMLAHDVSRISFDRMNSNRRILAAIASLVRW